MPTCYQREVAIKPNRSTDIVHVLRVKILVWLSSRAPQTEVLGGKVSRYLYQICWLFFFFLEAFAWRNLLQDLWFCGMSAQLNSKALPRAPWLWLYLKRRHSQKESIKKAKADGRVQFTPSLALSLSHPGKRDVEDDGDTVDWSSSQSGDSAETPAWHRLQGTWRGHLTVNQLEINCFRLISKRRQNVVD